LPGPRRPTKKSSQGVLPRPGVALSLKGTLVDRCHHLEDQQKPKREAGLSEISFKIIKGQSQSCKPGITLRSVEPGIQERRRRSEALRSAVNATRNQWKGSRFCTRIQLLSKISKTAPKGSVREDIIGQFGDPCPLVTRGTQPLSQ